jgi:hypothetical protein
VIPSRLGTVAAPALIAAAILALGSAAAPDRPRSWHPRLLVTPAKLRSARGIAPGDHIQRLAVLRRLGRGRLSAVYFEARAERGSGFEHGLRAAIDRCSRRWRKQAAVYSCPGRRFAVLSRRPLLGRRRLKRLGLRARRVAYLRLVISFPATVGNSLQGRSLGAIYSFVGVAQAART